MVDIEPYEYQRKTNLKEHNDLVAKINEIVDVINNTNMDTIIPRIAKIETDITGINSTDALQWKDIESVKDDIGTITPKITKLEQDVTDINSTDAAQNTDISNLKTKDSEHDTRLGTIDTEINGINKSLVSDVAILNGTTTGNVKVRIGREDTPPIDSNDYNIQKPTSVELVQGSAPAMVKAQITLSDGTVLISDDFMFTTEAIGTDVYISSFTFKNGNVAGTISADIGLSNGSTLTANNFAVPTDPSIVSSIEDLRTSLGTKADLSNTSQSIKAQRFTGTYGSFNAIYGQNIRFVKSGSNVIILRQTGNNKNPVEVLETVSGSDVSIGNLAFIDPSGNPVNFSVGKVEVAELKATVDDHTASINTLNTDVAELQIDKVDVAQGIGNAGKVLGINSAGNVEPITISSGGNEWETLDLSNLPTDFSAGDELEIDFKMYDCYWSEDSPSNWNTDFSSYSTSATYDAIDQTITVKVKLVSFQQPIDLPITTNYISYTMFMVLCDGDWSTFSNWNGSSTIGRVEKIAFNGASSYAHNENVTRANIANYVSAIRRKKATT